MTSGIRGPVHSSAVSAPAVADPRDVDSYIAGLSAFVSASPCSYFAVAEAERLLVARGFTALSEEDPWPAVPGAFVVRREGAFVAWRVPEGAGPVAPARIIGCHTDSPALVVKPVGGVFPSREWRQVAVEVYGGPLLASWFDRDLELAGRIVDRSGAAHLVRTGPLLRVPHLAIHLDRTVNESFSPNRQLHVQPVLGTGEGPDDIPSLLAETAGVPAADVVGYDLYAFDTQPPARIGSRAELLASPRLDNLSSVYAGIAAIARPGAAPSGDVEVLVGFDHEEIGSETRSGAAGSLLSDVLARIRITLGADAEQSQRAASSSWLLSLDAGHVWHPNYPERYDPRTAPRCGEGPLLKVNASRRYATDARGEVLWSRACERAGVAWQTFVSRNDVPCGTTIGPLSATRVGVSTVDAGVGLLSMHSVRELAHVADLAGLARAACGFYADGASA